NPIESTFATVRHRTIRWKGCLSNKTALAMVFKLVEDAQKNWRRLDDHNQLPKLWHASPTAAVRMCASKRYRCDRQRRSGLRLPVESSRAPAMTAS
ncbi:hypothetical protein ABIB85_008273, partial [Bradyrhizobium sp. JR1.5]